MTDDDATDLPISARIPTFDHISLVPHLPNALNDPPGAPWALDTRATAARLGSRMLATERDVLMFFRGLVDNDPDGQQAIFLWHATTEGYAGWQQTAWTPINLSGPRKDVLLEEGDLRSGVAGINTGFDIGVFSYGATHFLYQPDHFAPYEDRLLIYYKIKERAFTWAGKTEPFQTHDIPLGRWPFNGTTTTFTIGNASTDRVCSVPEALEVRERRDGAKPVDRLLTHRNLGDPRGVTSLSYLFGWDQKTQATTVTYPHPDFSNTAEPGGKKHRLEIARLRTEITCVSESRINRDPATGSIATISIPQFKGPVITRESNSPGGELSTQSGADALGTSAVWQDSTGQIWMIAPDGGGQFPSNASKPPNPSTEGQGLAVRKALNPDGTEFGPPVRVVDWTAKPSAFAFGHRVQCATFIEDGFVYVTSSGGNTRHPSGRWSNDYPTGVMLYRCSIASDTNAQEKANWSAPACGQLAFMRGPINSPAGGGIWGPSIYKVGGTYYASSEHVGALPDRRTTDPDFDITDYSNSLTDWQLDLLRDDEYGGTRDRAVIENSDDLGSEMLTVTASFAFDDLRGTCLGKTAGEVPKRHDWWVEVDPNGRLVLTYVTPQKTISITSAPGAIAADGTVYIVIVSLRDKPDKRGGATLRLYLGDTLIGESSEKAVAPSRNRDDIQFGSRNDALQAIRGRMYYASVYADWVTGPQATADQAAANGKSAHNMVRQFPLPAGSSPKQALANIADKGRPLRLTGEAYVNRKDGAVEFDGGFLSYNEGITSNSLSLKSDMQSLAAAWDNPGIPEGEYYLQNIETGRYLTCPEADGAAPVAANKTPGPDAIWTLVRSREFIGLRRGKLDLVSTSRYDSNAPPRLAGSAPHDLRQFFLISKTEPDDSRSWVFANRDSSLRLRTSGTDGQVTLGYSDSEDRSERWEFILA